MNDRDLGQVFQMQSMLVDATCECRLVGFKRDLNSFDSRILVSHR